ncbi:MAG: pseudouridine synthase [Acidobacteriota bacterium]
MPASRTLLFWKPYGVLCQFTPEPGTTHATLADFVDVPDVYPAGRLDHDSEGLVVLTSDGALQHRITDPKRAHPRTYWAQVERIPDAAALQALRAGVLIEGKRTLPAKARLLDAVPGLPERTPPIRFRKNVPTAWIELTLTEGRNRQVRRMTAAAGHPTLRLVRVRVGNWSLDGLEPGKWREVR